MNILSIKGGGARGIIATRILMEVEKVAEMPICELFDYIGGTSVGALIATGLLTTNDGFRPKYTAEEIHKQFLRDVVSAFSWTYTSWVGSLFGLLGPSYTSTGLEKLVDEIAGNKKLGDLLKPVIFPAYNRMTCRAHYFNKEFDSDVNLKDILMSCTAAPTYFPSHTMEMNGLKCNMIDGGTVVNNTAELTLLHATREMNCINKNRIFVANVGTGKFNYTTSLKDGLITWAPIIVDTFMNGASENELFELSLSLSSDNYYIFDVPLDLKYDSTDNVRPQAIEYYLNETEKWIQANQESIIQFCLKLKRNKIQK